MRALKDKEVEKLFGKFDWHDCPNNKGMVVIDDKWRKDNIVHIEHEIPIIGRITCHKLVLFDFYRIFLKIWEAGLENEIDVHDFHRLGGCYVPRHKCWNIHRGLSRHTWGIAIDINVSNNPYGVKESKQHPAVIAIFEKYGFMWGGRWKTPDNHHFEVSDLWQPFQDVKVIKKP